MLFKPAKLSLRSVLFVCTANITRSTTAEALFKYHTDKLYDKWDVSSAGVKALTRSFPLRGENPHTVVRNYLRDIKNIRNYSHHSQQITKRLLRKYYWILVMEKAHKDYINKLGVPLENRMFTVREFGLNQPPDETDMPDPTNMERENYEQLFEIMDKEIPRIIDVLINKIIELEQPT